MKILQTFDKLDYEVTEEQADSIQQASVSGKQNGIWIGKDYVAFASIKGITDLKAPGQAYPALPPAKDFRAIIQSAKKGTHLKALGLGLKRAIARQAAEGKGTHSAGLLLELARSRYVAMKKQNDIPTGAQKVEASEETITGPGLGQAPIGEV